MYTLVRNYIWVKQLRKEAPYKHGDPLKTAVLLVNLGTPEKPTASYVRPYLRQFLSDPRVVEIPRILWLIILNCFILPFRPGKSAAKYQAIWLDAGSPLLVHGKNLAEKLAQAFKAEQMVVHVELAMTYGQPSVPGQLDKLRANGFDRILVLPLYPQYAASTSASVFDAVCNWLRPVRNVPEFRFVKHYHDHPAYISALAQQVQRKWNELGKPNFAQGDLLLFSFHGVPEMTLHNGDPYHCECHKTGRLLAQELGLDSSQYKVTFQSRFGKAKWLEPYTDETLKQLGADGVERLDVFCPGFLSDCLETLEEINMEGREDFLHAGGKHFNYIECLNSSDLAQTMMLQICKQHLMGWPVSYEQDAKIKLDLEKGRVFAENMLNNYKK